MALYLADSSVWAWADKGSRPDIAAKLAARLDRQEIATCVPVVLEVMHKAETSSRYEELFDTLFEPLEWLRVGDLVAVRALEVQRGLAAASHRKHRRPALHYLIAAAAEIAGDGVTIWFFDNDLRVICEHTGQAFEAEASTGPGH